MVAKMDSLRMVNLVGFEMKFLGLWGSLRAPSLSEVRV